MSVQLFEVVSFEPWKDGVVRIRIACDEPEGRVCHTFYARQEDYDDRVKERDTHAAEVARLTAENERLSARDEVRTGVLLEIEAWLQDGNRTYEHIHEQVLGLLHNADTSSYDGFAVVQTERDELREEVARLRGALHQISLCSQNSMSSREECGRIARAALAPAARKETT